MPTSIAWTLVDVSEASFTTQTIPHTTHTHQLVNKHPGPRTEPRGSFKSKLQTCRISSDILEFESNFQHVLRTTTSDLYSSFQPAGSCCADPSTTPNRLCMHVSSTIDCFMLSSNSMLQTTLRHQMSNNSLMYPGRLAKRQPWN